MICMQMENLMRFQLLFPAVISHRITAESRNLPFHFHSAFQPLLISLKLKKTDTLACSYDKVPLTIKGREKIRVRSRLLSTTDEPLSRA